MPDYTTRLNLPKPLGNETHTRAKFREFIEAVEIAAGVRDQVEPLLTNRSGGALVVGDVVILDSAADSSVVSTTAAGALGAVVSLEAPANLATGRFAAIGQVVKVNVVAGVTRGQFLSTSTTAKQAQGTATPVKGTFAIALTDRDVNGQVVATMLGAVLSAGEQWTEWINSSTTADGSATVFNIGSGVAASKVDVKRNGLVLTEGASEDYTHTAGDSTVTFNTAPASGAKIAMKAVPA